MTTTRTEAPSRTAGLARLVAAQAATSGWDVVDLGAANGPEPVTVLRGLADLLMDRYTAMSDRGATHFSELDGPLRPVLVVADRVDLLAAWDPMSALHLGMLARCGRAAGILLLATAADPAALPDDLRASLASHVVLEGGGWDTLLRHGT